MKLNILHWADVKYVLCNHFIFMHSISLILSQARMTLTPESKLLFTTYCKQDFCASEKKI